MADKPLYQLLRDSPVKLHGPGPTELPEQVRYAMGSPTIGHMDKRFYKFMDGLQRKIREVYQVGDGAFAMPISATGSGVWKL